QTVTLEAPFVAEPLPTMTWLRQSTEIQPNDRIQATLTEKLAKLIINKSVRADTGKYMIRLVNGSGSEQAECEVIVLGPPSIPRGPLEVKEVTKNSVTLAWKAPEDTGGKEVTNYVVEKRDKKSGDWIRVNDAVIGTQVTIPKLKEGHEYEFRVMAENSNGLSEPLVTEKAVHVKNPFTEPGQPGSPECVSRDRDHIEIKWSPPRNDGGSPIKGYIVERRDKTANRKDWSKITKGDLNKTPNFVDENVTAGKEYEYRVTAVNEAGPGEPSTGTGGIFAKPENEKPSFDLSALFGPLGKKEIRVKAGEPLTIDLPISGSPAPTITWIKDGEDVQPTRDTQLESNDIHAKLYKPSSKGTDAGKYKVKLKNASGEDECDIDVIVMGKPGVPGGPLTATETTKNSVSLQWKPPKENGGSDVTGYIIEKCLENSDNWEKVSGAFSQPKGTIKGLDTNKTYKFRVKAENIFGVGEPLETISAITVKPPYDTPDAPDVPEIIDYNSSYIKLKWKKPSKDGGNPIQGYNVEMREKNTGNWKLCNNFPTTATEYIASGLREGQTYEFRVAAVNEAGPGTPSKPTQAQKAEVPIFPADAPDQPKVEKVTKDSVTLSWKKPLNNGGSRITGYVIEKRSPDSHDWEQVGTELSARDHSYTIPNLTEGDELMFRVRAVNAVGPGEPSRSTDGIKIGDQLEKPAFLDDVKDITVPAGKDFKVQIRCRISENSAGIPQTTTEWTVDDKNLAGDDRVVIQTLDNVVTLLNHKAQRSDTGSYKLVLKNREGTSQVKFRVTVLDHPGKPEGPLEATNVTGEGCTLNWKAPTDDGGNDVKHYVIEKREAGTEQWTKVGPPSSGTTCDVKGLEDGKRYEFRVAAENENGLGEPLEIGSPVKAKWAFNSPEAPGTPKCASHTSDSVTLQWARPSYDGGSPIKGYLIEKKEKGTDRWIPVNREPVAGQEHTVPGLTNGKEYEFRVAAVNKAGPSEYAQTESAITARPPDVAPKAVGFGFGPKEITVRAGENLRISVPFVGSPIPQTNWTKGGNDLHSDGNTQITVKDGVAELLIPKVKGSDSGTYSCLLKNPLGQDIVQMKVIVVDKPDKCEGPLEISDIRPDSCILQWKPPKSDGNSPISNYIIEKFDTKKGDWQKVSSFCRVPFYEVVGLNEGTEYKFRVTAENAIGQSEPLESEKSIVAKKPFSAPQGPCNLEVRNQTENAITLKWDRPKNDGGSKVTQYQVEIRKPDSDIWVPVTDFPVKGTELTVDNLQPNKLYEFRVKAKNAAGWSQPTILDQSVTLKPNYVPPSPPNVPEVKKVGKNYVDLAWSAPINDGGSRITGYVVEKKSPESDQWIRAVPYLVVDNNVTVADLIENSEVEFRVKAVNKAGEGEPSVATNRVKISEFPNGRKPTFSKKIVDVNAALNSEASFTVEYDANPAPEVKWFRNGMELSASGRYRISTEPNNSTSTLTFLGVWDADNNSTITCELVNPLGKESCEALFHVKTPPKLDREPGDQKVKLGDTLKVKIPINGKGPYTFKVKKDDQTIPDSDKRVRVQEFDDYIVMTIPDVDRDDTGKYVINVANDSGSINVPMKVKVTAPPTSPQGPLEISNISKDHCTLSWKPPTDDGGSKIQGYTIERRDVSKGTDQWIPVTQTCKDLSFTVPNLLENHEYEFRVMATNENGTSEPLCSSSSIVAKLSFKPPSAPGQPNVAEMTSSNVTLTWEKPTSDGGGPITGYWVEKKEQGTDKWAPVNLSPTQNTKLTVPNLAEDHTYEFRVIAENEAGKGNPSETSKPCKVKDPNAAISPEFLKKLKNVEANEGKTVCLEVEVTGTPKPEIEWYKGTKELFDSTKYSISRDGDKYVMVINNVTPDDIDEYTVKAKNKGGSRMCRCNVTVRSPPRLRLPPKYHDVLTYDKGENIQIKIPYTGSPLPNVTLLHGDEDVTKANNVSIDVGERAITLTIRNADKNTSGPYRIKLHNNLGEDEATLRLHVSDVPTAPQNVQVDSVSDGSAVISWRAPDDDGGTFITNYIIEKLDSETGKWSKCGTSRFTHFTAESLQSNKPHQFRIIAENIHGTGEPSEPTKPVQTSDVDANRKSRGHKDEDLSKRKNKDLPKLDNYDRCFWDIRDKGREPQPATLKLGSVHDYYDILEEIGRGAFGVVHRAIERATGKTFAAKFIPTLAPADKTTVRREIEVMSDLNHKKLLHLHDAFEEEFEMIMITEFVAGDELFDRIADPNYKMTENEAKKYMRQLCQGLEHMHENNIVHLDLKPENIMCETKTSTNIKICDFGLATKLAPNEVVKVSVATVEFAAPEIVDHDAVGFYTDMWAAGVLSYVILSGLSPFSGANDNETIENIRKCDIQFPNEAFSDISDNGKDFIKKLLLKNRNDRMTVHAALDHPWLREDKSELDTRIASSRFDNVRQRVRGRYADMPDPACGIGRMAGWSSLRKNKPQEYKIYNSSWDRREAAPRFILRPRNAHVLEGQNAEFDCRIIAASPPVVTWYRDNVELRQSTKHLKKYNRNNYKLEIKRCIKEDKGEYVVKATNSYSDREYAVFLTVESRASLSLLILDLSIATTMSYYHDSSWSGFSRALYGGSPKHHHFESPFAYRCLYKHRLLSRSQSVGPRSLPEAPRIESREVSHHRRVPQDAELDTWREPDSKPVFTFLLRPRLIQEGINCKLICCVSGKPTPKVQWFKDRTQLSEGDSHYITASVSGVCTLEISSCEVADSGTFRCHATNPLGFDETSCMIHIEEARRTRRAPSTMAGESDHTSSRARSPSPVRSSGKDSNWREKLGAGDKPAEAEKPKKREQRKEAPKFIDQLSSVTVFEGSTAKLRCEVKGKPTPNIEWLKNGEPISKDSRINESYDDDVATLTIKKVKMDDDGEYICRASNEEGSDNSSAQLTIKAHVASADDELYAEYNKEDEVSVEAAAPSEPSASPEQEDVFARMDMKYLKNFFSQTTEAAPAAETAPPESETTPSTEPVQPSTDAAASETEAKKEEKLPSEAVAEIPADAAASTEPALVAAPVAEPEAAAKPASTPAGKTALKKGVEEKKPAAVPEKKPVGAAAKKAVEPAKKPEPEKKDTKKVDDKKKVDEKKVEPEKKDTKKVEEKPKADDKKTKKVEETSAPPPAEEKKPEEDKKPKDKKEEEEKPLEKKEEKVKFTKHIHSQNLMEGDRLILDCTCTGDELELVWLRNNKEIPENPDFKRERDGDNFRLNVSEVFSEDSGVFSALLKNATSTRLSSCSVIIQAKDEEPLDPTFVEFPQNLTIDESGKAKFTCKLSGSAPMTAEWNFQGKALARDSSRFVFVDGEPEFSMEIPVVLATDEGQYHVTLSNDKGEITAAFSLHVLVDQS
ncbi:unnamed protein product, partial [Didymodactylos carnosus]